MTKTITVPVHSDMAIESNETFLVNLSNATNATLADGQGVGHDHERRRSSTPSTSTTPTTTTTAPTAAPSPATSACASEDALGAVRAFGRERD